MVDGILSILGADKSRFGKLQRDLQDNIACGTSQFPTTLTTAYNLLITTEAAIGAASDMDTPNDSGGHSRRHRGAYRNNNNNGPGNPGNKQVNQANLAGHTGLSPPCVSHTAQFYLTLVPLPQSSVTRISSLTLVPVNRL